MLEAIREEGMKNICVQVYWFGSNFFHTPPPNINMADSERSVLISAIDTECHLIVPTPPYFPKITICVVTRGTAKGK